MLHSAARYPDEDMTVWGSGEQGRAFVHFRDAVNALVLALKKGWGHGYIQIGPSFCTSVRELAERIIAISGKDIKPFYDLSKPEGDKARCADYSKAEKILGWKPEVPLQEGLSEMYEWIVRRLSADENFAG